MDTDLVHELHQAKRDKAKLIGLIQEERKLLTDALSAAHRGNRNHVVIDHLERVLFNFSRLEQE